MDAAGRKRGAGDGLATRRITVSRLETRVLILTTFDLDDYVLAALRAGASGFLLKDATSTQLIDAVRTVAAGESLLAPQPTRRLIERYLQLLPADDDAQTRWQLTPRELEILTLVATGHSNAEIGRTLFISEPTVKTHLTSVFRKLGVRDRVQAVIAAYDAGVVAPQRRGPGFRQPTDASRT